MIHFFWAVVLVKLAKTFWSLWLAWKHSESASFNSCFAIVIHYHDSKTYLVPHSVARFLQTLGTKFVLKLKGPKMGPDFEAFCQVFATKFQEKKIESEKYKKKLKRKFWFFFNQIIGKTMFLRDFSLIFPKGPKRGQIQSLGSKKFQGQALFCIVSARFVKSGPQKGQMASLS